MNQAGNIKGACTMIQRNTESYKPSEITRAAGYYIWVKQDGLDVLRMRG